MDEKTLTEWINNLIREDKLYIFYKSKYFKNLREYVLSIDDHVCFNCHRKNATIAHHINHVREHPQLALSIYYFDKQERRKKRNIVSVCKACHNVLHPEKFGSLNEFASESRFVNEERW